MALKVASIAMSFASAMLVFNNFNSSSILSKVASDKSISEIVMGSDGRRLVHPLQRRCHHIPGFPTRSFSFSIPDLASRLSLV